MDILAKYEFAKLKKRGGRHMSKIESQLAQKDGVHPDTPRRKYLFGCTT